jgi:hypothetical protein
MPAPITPAPRTATGPLVGSGDIGDTTVTPVDQLRVEDHGTTLLSLVRVPAFGFALS